MRPRKINKIANRVKSPPTSGPTKIRRILIGPEVEGVFTLFAILFVFVGLNTLGMALIGEYVGRIYREVRGRPRYVIRQTLGPKLEQS